MDRSGQKIPFINNKNTPYELHQIDCWIQNKNPGNEEEFKKLMNKVKQRARLRLAAIEKKAKKYKVYAHHFK